MTTATWATTLVHGALVSRSVPAEPTVTGNAPHLLAHERARYRAAAHHARRVHPGALGELVNRELLAHAEFGVQLAATGRREPASTH